MTKAFEKVENIMNAMSNEQFEKAIEEVSTNWDNETAEKYGFTLEEFAIWYEE